MKQLNLFSLVLFFVAISLFSNAKNQVIKLVCEYHENPIGIDVEKPRLSWQILADGQEMMQTAYEIRVADSPKNLSKKSKQIWATGKVSGSESVNVVYGRSNAGINAKGLLAGACLG